MNLVKTSCRFGLIVAFGVLLLTGCSGKDDPDAQTAASALIQENKNIVAFGHISVKELLNKLDYKNLPKVNAIIGPELESWEKGLDLSKPAYYALQAPFAQDGTPDAVYGLVNVKDQAKLIDKFNSMGYTVEKTGEISYIAEGDITVGVRNQLAIVISKKAPYDGKALIVQAFEQTEGDESEGKTEDILAAKGDIVNGVSIERLYSTSNTSLNNLKADKKAELDKLIADGFVKTTFSFDKGEARIKSENMFSEELKDRLFYKEDPSASIRKKLGNGTPWMGIATNIDMRKLEAFLSDFAPEAYKKLNESLPGEASMALAMMGEQPLGKMFSGQMGFVAVGNPAETMGMVPQFNFYMGLGSKGDFITGMMEEYFTGMMLEKQGDAYVMDNMAISLRKDGIYGYTITSGLQQGLKIPSFAKDFGKNSFSAYVNFGQLDIASLELPLEGRVLELMDTFTINANKNGGEVVLTTKDKSQNILKQIGLFYTKLGEEQMNNLAVEPGF